VIPYFDQNYIGFVRGDVDVNWQSAGLAFKKTNFTNNPVLFQATVNGDEIILPINYNLEIPLISLDLDLTYNQAVMKFERIATTNLTSRFHLAYNNELNHRLKIGAFSQHAIVSQGTLLFIIFKTTDLDHADTQVHINRFLVNNFCLPTTTVNVSFNDQSSRPDRFELYQNYPNPFNSSTTIPFSVSEAGKIKLVIYNLLGEELLTLLKGMALPGKYRLTWDGKDNSGNYMATGIYICKFTHPTGNEKIKIIYTK
jgi:hypothetical protein